MRRAVPLWALILVAFICLVIGAVAVKVTNPPQMPSNPTDSQSSIAQISEADAKKIALDKAGLTESDVIFQRTEKDYENGILVYEIEFRQGRTEYTAEISVSDGKIISWEVDTE